MAESSWYALFAPKGTPKRDHCQDDADLTRILALPDMKERDTTLGYRLIGGSPDRLEAMLSPRDRQMGRGGEERIAR